jgi:proteasome lid subunit RPN8/RPN11
MKLEMSAKILEEIHNLGERAYPEEGAGLLLGQVVDGSKRVSQVLVLNNSREQAARRKRYLLEAEDYANGEELAERLGLEVLGVFHSHPDHPDVPSEFDREWAWPWFSYLITSVRDHKSMGSRSWCLREDRSGFVEEEVVVIG